MKMMDSWKRTALCAVLLTLAGTGLAQATTKDGKVDQQLLGTAANQQFGSLLNAQGDFNHDGIPDLVVGSPAGTDMRGAVDIFYGKTKGLAQQAAFHYEGPMAWAQVGSSPVVADVNGDGYPDLIVGASNYSGAQQYSGGVLVFFGKEHGISAEPKQILEGPSTNSFFGFRIRSLGDFNHDGYDDIAVGAMGANGSLGQIYIFKGGPKGLKKKPVTTLAGAAPWIYFGQMFDVGDVNGDGIADIIVGASSPTGGIPGMSWIYHGTPTGYANRDETLFAPVALDDTAMFGSNVTFLGDVDGDGFGDLAVGAPRYADGTSSGMVSVFYGSATGPSGSARTQTITAGSDKLLFMGDNLLGQRDFNGDGYMDLVVGTSNFARPNDQTQPFPGAIWIYRGGANGLDTSRIYKLNGTKDTRDEFGMSLEVGDVNGDGAPDLLTGSGVYSDTISQQGVVRVIFGVPK
ncbi:MAG TPA: FG-GAP-like repeat-containing protein [Ideonella sp.]|nr:FG-GAP-like repeat-containing protein [Ideonella sp.]